MNSLNVGDAPVRTLNGGHRAESPAVMVAPSIKSTPGEMPADLVAAAQEFISVGEEFKREFERRSWAAHKKSDGTPVALSYHLALVRCGDAEEGLWKAAEDAKDALSALDDDGAAEGTQSYRDWIEEIFKFMRDSKTGMLDKYQELLANYIDFFSELTDAMAALTAVWSEEDMMAMRTKAARDKLATLMDKWGSGYWGVAEKPLAEFDNAADAEAFLKSLGANDYVVMKERDGKFYIEVSLEPLNNLRNSLEHNWPTEEDGPKPDYPDGLWYKTTPAYQAWLAMKDAMIEQFQSLTQIFAERMSRQTTMFDSLVKILSSTMEQVNESNKMIAANMS